MDKIRKALEAVNHIFMCEDEGMASGQPTKDEYIEARELVAAALAELEAQKPVVTGQKSENREMLPTPYETLTGDFKPH